MSDGIAPGHLMTNGLQGSADLVEEPGQVAVKLLEQCKRKTLNLTENQETMKCYCHDPHVAPDCFTKLRAHATSFSCHQLITSTL